MTFHLWLFVIAMLVLFVAYAYSQWKIGQSEKYLEYVEVFLEDAVPRNNSTHQQEDIFSISGRVPADNNWCARDSYLNPNRYNRTQQTTKPPADDAPPSYEEAIRMATAASLADQVPPYTSSISNSSAMTSVLATEPKPSSN